jgi:hypothetical protein
MAYRPESGVRSSFASWDSLMPDVGDLIRASGAGTAHMLA